MSDLFALLGLTPRPWLDPQALQESFLRLAAVQHPDAVAGGTAQFAALNAAHAILRDPAARLRHLLEAEFPDAPSPGRAAPAGVADLFAAVAGLQQRAGEFLTRQAAAASPLTRALLAAERAEVARELTAMLLQIDRLIVRLDDHTRALDGEWNSQRETTMAAELAELAQSYAYLQRWRGQLSETRTRLTL